MSDTPKDKKRKVVRRLTMVETTAIINWMEKNRGWLEPLQNNVLTQNAIKEFGWDISDSTIPTIRKELGWTQANRGAAQIPKMERGELVQRLKTLEDVVFHLSAWALKGGWEPSESRKALIENISNKTPE